ncbi:hypothetical protein HZH68_009791 [Vespula germanica]|uniref:Uncharacterized protein n=1 Tax=Vespula germanica TaxID=30212 RepID=A0A834JY32_VESGE|nr:hypothetical protein HZH68_009791 [Vespula germanica]
MGENKILIKRRMVFKSEKEILETEIKEGCFKVGEVLEKGGTFGNIAMEYKLWSEGRMIAYLSTMKEPITDSNQAI